MKSRGRAATHIVIAVGPQWSLSWPVDLWSCLSEDERAEVIRRQSALLIDAPGQVVGRLQRRRKKLPTMRETTD